MYYNFNKKWRRTKCLGYHFAFSAFYMLLLLLKYLPFNKRLTKNVNLKLTYLRIFINMQRKLFSIHVDILTYTLKQLTQNNDLYVMLRILRMDEVCLSVSLALRLLHSHSIVYSLYVFSTHVRVKLFLNQSIQLLVNVWNIY